MSKDITKAVKQGAIEKKWLIADASGKILGRFASKIASIVRGKNKYYYTPSIDCGDNVIVINADKIILTGKKAKEKVYVHYTNFPGGQRTKSFSELEPCDVVKHAIKGMLPKNKLGNGLMRNVRVFNGPEHNMQSVKPLSINI